VPPPHPPITRLPYPCVSCQSGCDTLDPQPISFLLTVRFMEGWPTSSKHNSKRHIKSGAPFFPRSLRKGWEARMQPRELKDSRPSSISPQPWIPCKWSSFRHYALRKIGSVGIESAWTATDWETETKGGPESRLASRERVRTCRTDTG
jgi:hypothetical protein